MKLKNLFSLVFVAITALYNAQVYVPKQVRAANEQYRNENFCEAASLCSKAYLKMLLNGMKKQFF